MGRGKAQHHALVKDNFVGTELNEGVSYAGIAEACGLIGVRVFGMADLTAALAQAVSDQKAGRTTFIEAMINQELGEPFRRDAMKAPVAVAGIARADMRRQGGPEQGGPAQDGS